jgi:hypothetical protein
MKTIIAGSRNLGDYRVVEDAVAFSGFTITEVVCGEASGADAFGKVWANRRGVAVRSFPANWKAEGRRAGYVRNVEMAEYVFPDGGLIAIWDGVSPGTKMMIDIAKELRLKVCVYGFSGGRS